MATPTPPAVLVIGASAGGVAALQAVLGALPATLPVPVLAVLHLPRDRSSRIAEVLAAVPAGRGVVAIGKAVHRHPFARATVDALRSARTTLVVDMGWPSDDRAYADVATFGASRLIGRALISLLAPPAGQENRP